MFFQFRLRKAAASFVHPLDPAPRTAILVPGFQSTRSLRVFPNGWDEAARKFNPAAVAGTFEQVADLADGGVQLTHAVICLSWDKKEFLTPRQRTYLWSAFGVPVFEQYLDRQNILLAYECDAHSALHATPAYTGKTFPGVNCPCGTGLLAFVQHAARPVADLALRPTG